jgi:hypothetical protein
MKRSAVVLILLLLVFSASGYAAYNYYNNHHVSSDLKRTLTAAMDPANKDSDIESYMHDARVQVRTKKDSELIGKMNQLLAIAAAQEQRYENTMERIRKSGEKRPVAKMIEIENEYRADHLPVPAKLKDQITTELKEERAEFDQQIKDDEADAIRAKKQESDAERLVAEIRHDLGLPPIVTK